MYVNKIEICKFKAYDNINWNNFCLGSASKDFTKWKIEKNEISLNGTVYDFSVDHSSIKKVVLNFYQCLMVKYNIK